MDIQTVEGIPALVLTDDGEGRSIKSEAGHRSVPIHSNLLRLGFLGYVEAIRASGADSLGPPSRYAMERPATCSGGGSWSSASRWDSQAPANPSVHCFRHTVRPLMRRTGFSDSTQDKVTGHSSGGSVGIQVYDAKTMQDIQAAVEAIQYPHLALPVVSPHAPT